jgi:hypothetical protein
MTKFMGHLPCPKCGSRDNLGEYDDHYFCFGCKYHKKKDDVHSLRKRVFKSDSNSEASLLGNFGEIPRNAMKWLLSYGISQEDIDEYGIKWDVKNQLLVLLDTAKYWQGRSFDKHKPKYMSSGSKPLTIYGQSDIIVLVEDIISAMRIARTKQFCSAPLLGSSLSYEFENQIVETYRKAIVWLDRDKAINSLRIKRKLQQRGVDSRVVITDNDPKEYSKGEILEWLKSR